MTPAEINLGSLGTGALPLTHPRFPGGGEPAWQIAYLFPAQGNWTEQDYLGLEDHLGGSIRIELSDGRLELLPMPTEHHQDIIAFLLESLHNFVRPRKLGKVSFSGIRIRLRNGENPKYREPDLAFMKAENAHRRNDSFWEGADLAMEVVSGDPHDRERDYETKVADYAEAGIAEYWIIDPDEKRIQVHILKAGRYELHGEFRAGSMATSTVLNGFAVSVNDVLSAG